MKKIVEEKRKPRSFRDLNEKESIRVIAEEIDDDMDLGIDAEADEDAEEEADEEMIVSFTEDGFDAFMDHVKEEWAEEGGYEDLDVLCGLIKDAASTRVGEPMTSEEVVEVTAPEEEGEEEEGEGEEEEIGLEDEPAEDEIYEFECETY